MDKYEDKYCYLRDLKKLGNEKIIAYCRLIINGQFNCHLKNQIRTEKNIVEILDGIQFDNKCCLDFYGNSKIASINVEIDNKVNEAIKNGVFMPFFYLTEAFKLDEFEKHCVIIALLTEFDPIYEQVFAVLQDSQNQVNPTIDFMIKSYESSFDRGFEYRDYFSDDSKLMKFFFKKDVDEGNKLSRKLILNERIVAFILEGKIYDYNILKYGNWYLPDGKLPKLINEQRIYNNALEFSRKCSLNKIVFHITGSDGIGKKTNVKYYAMKKNKPVLFVSFGKLLDEMGKLNCEKIQEVVRESIISDFILCIDGENILTSKKQCQIFEELVHKIFMEKQILFVVTNTKEDLRFDLCYFNYLKINIKDITFKESYKIWESVKGMYRFSEEIDFNELSYRYVLSPGDLIAKLNKASNYSIWSGRERISTEDINKAFSPVMSKAFMQMTTKIKLKYNWMDLLLGVKEKKILRDICNEEKIKNKILLQWGFDEKNIACLGTSILFTGEKGSGRQMGAEVLAKELGLDLYLVNMTAFNLDDQDKAYGLIRNLFIEASRERVVLLFPNADFLFSGRFFDHRIADFLLYQMNNYKGFSIMTLNNKKLVDDIKGSFSYEIDYTMPNDKYRKVMWLEAFPKKTPLADDVDIDFLVKNYMISGEKIKEAAFKAACFAAADGGQVRMKHIISALCIN